MRKKNVTVEEFRTFLDTQEKPLGMDKIFEFLSGQGIAPEDLLDVTEDLLSRVPPRSLGNSRKPETLPLPDAALRLLYRQVPAEKLPQEVRALCELAYTSGLAEKYEIPDAFTHFTASCPDFPPEWQGRVFPPAELLAFWPYRMAGADFIALAKKHGYKVSELAAAFILSQGERLSASFDSTQEGEISEIADRTRAEPYQRGERPRKPTWWPPKPAPWPLESWSKVRFSRSDYQDEIIMRLEGSKPVRVTAFELGMVDKATKKPLASFHFLLELLERTDAGKGFDEKRFRLSPCAFRKRISIFNKAMRLAFSIKDNAIKNHQAAARDWRKCYPSESPPEDVRSGQHFVSFKY